VRTTRLATNTLGDGYVEAIADETLLNIRKQQCKASHGKICGQAIKVLVPESEGKDRIGRFGWKDQHASLITFAADAYLNEMGYHKQPAKKRSDDHVQSSGDGNGSEQRSNENH